MNALFRLFPRSLSFSPCLNASPRLEHLPTPYSNTIQFSNLLANADAIEPALDQILSCLNRSIILSVLRNTPDPKIGFRIFIWASNHQHLRSASSLSMVQDFLEFNSDTVELLWETLNDVKNQNYKVSNYAFKVLINACFKAGMVEKALEAFGSIREFGLDPDTDIYNLILRFTLKKDVFLLGLFLYNQMLKTDCPPNEYTYNVLCRGLNKIGETDYAVKMFDEMLNRGLTPSINTFNSVILGLCRGCRVHEAVKLSKSMKEKNLRLDFLTCNYILFGLCKVGEINKAFAFLNAFVKDGYTITRFGYNCLIEGLFKAGRLKEARAWFNHMIIDGIKPDKFSYSVMIKGASNEGALFDALQIIKQMNSQGVVPDSSCYNYVIKGFCDIGAAEIASSLLSELSNKGLVDKTSYDILISGLCRNGMVDEAEKLFNKMEDNGFPPSVHTFNALMAGFCKSGDINKAKLLFHKMSLRKNSSMFLRLRASDSANLHSLIEKLCESGLINKAYNILKEVADSGVDPNVATYNTLIRGLCKPNTLNGAWNLFLHLQSKGLSPDKQTYFVLMRAFLISNREQEALKIFDLMLKNNCYPDMRIYQCLIINSCRKMNLPLACSLWVQYLSTTNVFSGEILNEIKVNFDDEVYEVAIRRLLEVDLKSTKFDPSLYMNFLVGLCQSRKVEDATRIFDVLREVKVIVNGATCAKVIRLMCEEGKLEFAFDVFMHTVENGTRLKYGVCNILVSCLLGSKEMEGYALDVIGNMKDLGYDLDAYLLKNTRRRLQKVGFLLNHGGPALVRMRLTI